MLVHHYRNVNRVLRAAQNPGDQIKLFGNIPQHIVLSLLGECTGIAADFDGTLTKSHSHWFHIDSFLSEEARAAQQQLRDEYHERAHELEETEREELERGHVHQNFVHFSKAKLKAQDFERAGTLCPPREGIKELFSLFTTRLVVSFGLRPSIQAFFSHNAFPVERVVAGHIVHNEEDTSCYAEDLVVSGNKGVRLREVLHEFGLLSSHVLRVGDSSGDRHLFSGDTLNVMMLPPGEPEKVVQTGRLRTIERFWDTKVPFLVLADDTFYPLLELVQHARRMKAA
jgi:2-hydroxy-3-keto-5-methylthiopentenyl-1-phosphate phosphatase